MNKQLNEMPYINISGYNIDMNLEKSFWYEKFIQLLKLTKDKEKTLEIFYSMKWRDILKRKFKELDPIQQVRLLNLLPYKFKRDMNLMESVRTFKDYYMLNVNTNMNESK